jgi:hypothetical protein
MKTGPTHAKTPSVSGTLCAFAPLREKNPMNTPFPNRYDPQNAAALVQFAADAYSTRWGETPSNPNLIGDEVTARRSLALPSSRPTVIENEATDTRAVIYQTERDVIVAFRGTRSLRNFVTDIRARRVPLFPGSEAEVHEGFQQALNGVYDDLLAGVEQLLRADEDARQRVPTGVADAPRLWITGHSLGGALAMLCAWRISNLQSEISNAPAGVYTFGEPRVGNAAFRDCYDARLKSCTFRVVNAADLVPHVPWLCGRYRHCGHEVFYSRQNAQEAQKIISCASCASSRQFQLDRSLLTYALEDALAMVSEFVRPTEAEQWLADHHVSRYVALLNSRWGETPSNPQSIYGSTESRPTIGSPSPFPLPLGEGMKI